jgi:chromosome segregation ATPase
MSLLSPFKRMPPSRDEAAVAVTEHETKLASLRESLARFAERRERQTEVIAQCEAEVARLERDRLAAMVDEDERRLARLTKERDEAAKRTADEQALARAIDERIAVAQSEVLALKADVAEARLAQLSAESVERVARVDALVRSMAPELADECAAEQEWRRCIRTLEKAGREVNVRHLPVPGWQRGHDGMSTNVCGMRVWTSDGTLRFPAR